MSKISNLIMREKLDVAEFYANAMSGEVLELRRNTATISTPFGCEHVKYWELRDFKQERDQKHKQCVNRIKSIFKKLRAQHG